MSEEKRRGGDEFMEREKRMNKERLICGEFRTVREKPGDDDFRYMTEDELEALIAEVETHGMLAPPAYLKDLIMEEAGKCVKLAGKKGISRKRARIQFMIYSAKIIGAAAVAIFCLTMVPMDPDRGMETENQRLEKMMEEDMAYYQKESERIRNDLAGTDRGFRSLLENMLGEETVGTAASVWNDIVGWF